MTDFCPICTNQLVFEKTAMSTSSCKQLDHKYYYVDHVAATFLELVIYGGYVIYYYPDKITGHQINGGNHFTINQKIKPNKDILSLIKNHFLLS